MFKKWIEGFKGAWESSQRRRELESIKFTRLVKEIEEDARVFAKNFVETLVLTYLKREGLGMADTEEIAWEIFWRNPRRRLSYDARFRKLDKRDKSWVIGHAKNVIFFTLNIEKARYPYDLSLPVWTWGACVQPGDFVPQIYMEEK